MEFRYNFASNRAFFYNMKNKIIVILGQTASGKTELSIRLAKKFRGEIISADSRQVYKGLDIGSGKITKQEMQGVPHYLLDVANPKRKFTVSQYQKLALAAIKKIYSHTRVRGSGDAIPFLVGGTGFYIQSIVDGLVIPEVKPNWKLRKNLESKTTDQLFSMLKKLDPGRAALIDQKNPRRLIRAIEIVMATGKPVPKTVRGLTSYSFDILQIGIKKSPKELKMLIRKRLQKRMKRIITEVKKLHANGLSYKRLEELGLEYRFVAQYIQGKPFGALRHDFGQAAQDKLTYKQMIEKLQKEIEHYAKRQMTWFKRDKRIHWIKNYEEAKIVIDNFLNII